jgi:hypothetical protein
MSDTAATRADLRDAMADLKAYLAAREGHAIRWVVGMQLLYVVSTLAAVWFLVGQR